jgi:hypothetical protein
MSTQRAAAGRPFFLLIAAIGGLAIFGSVATAAIAERYPDRRAAMLSSYSPVTIVGRPA